MNEWKAPGKRSIVKCAVNQRQVVVALTGGELLVFEMDPVSTRLRNTILVCMVKQQNFLHRKFSCHAVLY